MNITYFVEGTPKAQPRVKAFSRGRHAGVYDPGTADGWKECIKAESIYHTPDEPLQQPLKCNLTFLLPRPQYLLKPKIPNERIPHAIKPDRDNLDKAVLDALTKTRMWEDDALVYSGTVEKLYVSKDEPPGCIISIETNENTSITEYIAQDDIETPYTINEE